MDLSSHEKACGLIGRYINTWSWVESDLSWGIRKIYGLEFSSGTIITGNLGLGGKVAVLRSSIAEKSRNKMTEQWREEADSLFAKISSLINDRNIAAHTYFEATDEGDVLFVRLHVKKGFEERELIWTSEQVLEKCEKLHDVSYGILRLVEEVTHARGGLLIPRQPSEVLSVLTPLYLEVDSTPPQE